MRGAAREDGSRPQRNTDEEEAWRAWEAGEQRGVRGEVDVLPVDGKASGVHLG